MTTIESNFGTITVVSDFTDLEGSPGVYLNGNYLGDSSEVDIGWLARTGKVRPYRPETKTNESKDTKSGNLTDLTDYVLIKKDHYRRLVGLAVSEYARTEGTHYCGNHLAEEGIRTFLQELGEWSDFCEEWRKKKEEARSRAE